MLRKALGESPAEHVYIETIPKHGYRFVADVAVRELTSASRAGRLGRLLGALGGAGVVLALLWTSGSLEKVRGWKQTAYRIAGLSKVATPGRLSAYPSLAPDATWMVYASDQGEGGPLQLWRQLLPDGEPVQLTHDRTGALAPAVSPDGRWIAYQSAAPDAGIWMIPSAGGAPKRIAHFARSPRFSPDSRWLAYWIPQPHSGFGKAYYLPVVGEAEPLPIAREFDDVHQPAWTPDGQHFIVCGTRRTGGGPGQEHDFWLVARQDERALQTGVFPYFNREGLSPHIRLLPATAFQWLGRELVFTAEQQGKAAIWILPLSQKTWRALHGPRPLYAAGSALFHPSITAGSLAFATVTAHADVWRLPLDPHSGRTTGEAQRVTGDPADDLSPALDRDGGRMVFLSSRSGTMRLCYQVASSAFEWELAKEWQTNRIALSADGGTAYCRVMEGSAPQKQAIYAVDLPGGQSRKVCPDCGAPASVSPDGKLVLFQTGSAVSRLGAVEVATGRKWEFLGHSHHGVQTATVSPDGRWLAFQLDRGWDGKQLFVAPFRQARPIDEKDWVPVTPPRIVSQRPAWSQDSRVLYFLSDRDRRRCVWAQTLDPVTKRPVGDPWAVAHFHDAKWTPLTLHGLPEVYAGLSAARGALVLSLSELKGSVWIASLER